MVVRIEKDVRIALQAEAVLERGNDLIRAKPDAKYPGASSYGTIQNSLALNLALTLSRLFDQGSKRYPHNKKDLASIPLMIRLLKQRRCRQRLVDEARNWTPQIPRLADSQALACEQAIEKAIRAYKVFVSVPRTRAIAHRLKRFRNNLLAHSMMFDTLKTLPTYADLSILVSVSSTVIEGALLAVHGKHHESSDFREAYNDAARQFWRFALGATGKDAARLDKGRSA